jgi:outer membrane protein OmpA-like peptidoglycan-associated protein
MLFLFPFVMFCVWADMAWGNNCQKAQNRAAIHIQDNATILALEAIEPFVEKCKQASIAIDGANYAYALGRREQAFSWLVQGLKWSTNVTDTTRIKALQQRFSKAMIERGQAVLAKERLVAEGSDLQGSRSSRGGFGLKGPAKTQRVKIERDACAKHRKGHAKQRDFSYKKVSEPLNLQILFDYDSSALRNDMKQLIDSVIISILKTKIDQGVCILVVGHTDTRGKHDANIRLSKRRAQTIVSYLASKKLNRDVFQPDGMGSLQPLKNGATEDVHRINRRVEFTVLSHN